MENAIAKCYFKTESDDKNLAYFTPHWLYIRRNKKQWRFENESVSQIGFDTHKLLIPLVLGGIATSLSILMLIRNLFDPFTSLVILLTGLVATYYGWLGEKVIIILQGKDATKIYVPNISTNLREFFTYYRQYLMNKESKLSIFHVAEQESFKKGQLYTHTSLQSEGFIHASKKSQIAESFDLYFPKNGKFVLLKLNTAKLQSPVKFELAPNRNETFPHIFGPINPESIESAVEFSNRDELLAILKGH